MYWVFMLGVATGMRTMTPIAVLCWWMWFAALPVTRLNFWMANMAAVIVFTALALGEYYGDTLARTPSRKSWFPLLSRILFAAVVGMAVFSSFGEPLAGGFVFGVAGALVGTFGGYEARMRLARKFGDDLPAALLESACALGLALLAMYFLHSDWINQSKIALLQKQF